MKRSSAVLVVISFMISLLSHGCRKSMDNNIKNNAAWHEAQSLRLPVRPIPRPKFPINICINSYDDIVQLLGGSNIIAKSVILANGIIMTPGPNIQSIMYQAVKDNQNNSIFTSRLVIQWRFPGGNWQLNISDVWSLGCVYQVYGEPPYTNLIKDSAIIQINTCFFWGTDSFTGERIAYVVL